MAMQNGQQINVHAINYFGRRWKTTKKTKATSKRHLEHKHMDRTNPHFVIDTLELNLYFQNMQFNEKQIRFYCTWTIVTFWLQPFFSIKDKKKCLSCWFDWIFAAHIEAIELHNVTLQVTSSELSGQHFKRKRAFMQSKPFGIAVEINWATHLFGNGY